MQFRIAFEKLLLQPSTRPNSSRDRLRQQSLVRLQYFGERRCFRRVFRPKAVGSLNRKALCYLSGDMTRAKMIMRLLDSRQQWY